MESLLLTLGHNSSAICIEDNTLVWGYETERLSRIKSDSAFPSQVLYKTMPLPHVAYVTHWDPYGDLMHMKYKHWMPNMLSGTPCLSHSPDMTHHDTHAWGALCFAGPDFPIDRSYLLVVDGFGNYGEHISIYRLTGDSHPNQLKLVRRYRGYDTSLGLLYQYATAFTGMKMHEDEYKYLGYETKLDPKYIEPVEECIEQTVETWFKTINNQRLFFNKADPLYNIGALDRVRQDLFRLFYKVLIKCGIEEHNSFDARCVIGYFAQGVLENCVLLAIKPFKPKNLIVAGGCHYNVKLNYTLSLHIDGMLCAYPLAGDQGNAIGLYYYHNPEFTFPNNLNWGVRTLKDVGAVDGLIVRNSVEQAFADCEHYIEKFGFVNLVRGSMEFGPRALCNTSTLARPTSDVVEKINHANQRNTVMPMAPVMTREMYETMFKGTNKVWKSEQYMITALMYQSCAIASLYDGVMHQYNYPNRYYTGRPQVVQSNDYMMQDLLKHFGGVLINTSFNYHGTPIVFDMESIIDSHRKQRLLNSDFHTIVIASPHADH